MITYDNRPVLVMDENTIMFKDNGTIQHGYNEADLEVAK